MAKKKTKSGGVEAPGEYERLKSRFALLAADTERLNQQISYALMQGDVDQISALSEAEDRLRTEKNEVYRQMFGGSGSSIHREVTPFGEDPDTYGQASREAREALTEKVSTGPYSAEWGSDDTPEGVRATLGRARDMTEGRYETQPMEFPLGTLQERVDASRQAPEFPDYMQEGVESDAPRLEKFDRDQARWTAELELERKLENYDKLSSAKNKKRGRRKTALTEEP